MKIWNTKQDVDRTLKTLAYYFEKLKTPNYQLLNVTNKLLKRNKQGLVQYFWEKLPEHITNEETLKEITQKLNLEVAFVFEDAKIIDAETGDYTAFWVFIWGNNILFLTPWKPTEEEIEKMVNKYKSYFRGADFINIFTVPTLDIRSMALTEKGKEILDEE